MPHTTHLHSGLLETVLIARIIMVIPGVIGPIARSVGVKLIRTARKKPRIFRFVRAVRRWRPVIGLAGGSIALVLFATFINWDIQHLSHDVSIAIKKTIRKDPAGALADAREELARMMKENRPRNQ